MPETLAAVPRALLRERGARRLRARARRGVARHDDDRDRLGSRARGRRRARRAVPRDRRGAEAGACPARRPASPSTPASRSSCCATLDEELAARLTERTGVAIGDRRLRVVRARRRPARDLEHGCVVARRRRRRAMSTSSTRMPRACPSRPRPARRSRLLDARLPVAEVIGAGQRHDAPHLALRRVDRRARDGEQYLHRPLLDQRRRAV